MTTRREARAQAASEVAPDAFPPEFLLGRCVDVWGIGDSDGWTRYTRGMDARADALGLPRRKHRPPAPHFGVQPWSVKCLDDTGRSDAADKALAQAGVTRADLPALREAAQAWVAAYRPPGVQRHPSG
jgi:hypothetical protein